MFASTYCSRFMRALSVWRQGIKSLLIFITQIQVCIFIFIFEFQLMTLCVRWMGLVYILRVCFCALWDEYPECLGCFISILSTSFV